MLWLEQMSCNTALEFDTVARWMKVIKGSACFECRAMCTWSAHRWRHADGSKI